MTDTNQAQAFNGINAVTGKYGMELSADDLVKRVFGKDPLDEKLRHRQEEFTTAVKDAQKKVYRNVREDIDGTDLAQAGWGIIFAATDPNREAIQDALAPPIKIAKSAGQSVSSL